MTAEAIQARIDDVIARASATVLGQPMKQECGAVLSLLAQLATDAAGVPCVVVYLGARGGYGEHLFAGYPVPGDPAPELKRAFCSDPASAGFVSVADARDALYRFVNSHFRNEHGERARIHIPADPLRDDDIRLSAFIARAEIYEAALRELKEARKPPIEPLCDMASASRCIRRMNAALKAIEVIADELPDSVEGEQ